MMATRQHLDDLLNSIERHAQAIPLTLGHERVSHGIPAASGWYVIRTTASDDAIAHLLPQQPGGHNRIKDRLERIAPLQSAGLTAVRDADGWWPVYTGHAKNLRSRAHEHLKGHPKTGCLALAQYGGELGDTQWEFRFTTVAALDLKLEDCQPLRILGEQLWRARFGWPVLCQR